jgi:hypothetical protein
MHILELTWQITHGTEGVDSDPTNPLSRAVNRLFETGKPDLRLSMCFLQDPFTPPDRDILVRWFGIFALSTKNRVIFFPGYSNMPDHFRSFRGQNLVSDKPFLPDHFTLECDLKHWHITSPRSASHSNTFRTVPLGDGRVLWFGMSIADCTVLREAKMDTVITAEVPSSDSRRRMEAFLASRENVDFPLVSLEPEAVSRYSPGFAHLSAIVGPSGFPDYFGAEQGFPYGSPYLLEPLPDHLEQLQMRSHRLSLSAEIDIQLSTSWLPGALTELIALTAPPEARY